MDRELRLQQVRRLQIVENGLATILTGKGSERWSMREVKSRDSNEKQRKRKPE